MWQVGGDTETRVTVRNIVFFTPRIVKYSHENLRNLRLLYLVPDGEREPEKDARVRRYLLLSLDAQMGTHLRS